MVIYKTKCCDKIKVGQHITGNCPEDAVATIITRVEIRQGWIVTTEFPVCATHYYYRTGNKWLENTKQLVS